MVARLREFVRSSGGGLYAAFAAVALHRLSEFVLIRFGVAAAPTCGDPVICSKRFTPVVAITGERVQVLPAPVAAAAAAAAAAASSNGFKPIIFGCVDPSCALTF